METLSVGDNNPEFKIYLIKEKTMIAVTNKQSKILNT